MSVTYLPVETIQNFIVDVFLKCGVPEEDARLASDVLITSDLRGIESHGVGRLKYYYDRIKTGQHQVKTNLEVIRESPTTAVVDGHHGTGMIIGVRSMQMAIEKARQYGMGSVAVRNSTHFGIDGYYPLMAVKAGMIGMSFTNARPAVAPTFGVKPMLGTNPIAFGCPTDEPFPFVYDAATPIIQRGKVEVSARAGKEMLPGWVVDQENQPMTDPLAILAGFDKSSAAFLPLGGSGETYGGHKGYGLGVMVEIFSSALQSGSFLYGLTGFDKNGNRQPYAVGHFFMAINIEAFTTLDEFQKNVGDVLRELRASTKAPGQPRIYTAGEKEYEAEQRVRRDGIEVNSGLQKELKFLQEELGLTQYDLGF
jgi:L-2-hydroxycarboxylate dehydrogenase (NAD+)